MAIELLPEGYTPDLNAPAARRERHNAIRLLLAPRD